MGLKIIGSGAYAMVYVGTKNTMKIWRVPEVALKESNKTGWLYFVSFYTCKRINTYI